MRRSSQTAFVTAVTRAARFGTNAIASGGLTAEVSRTAAPSSGYILAHSHFRATHRLASTSFIPCRHQHVFPSREAGRFSIQTTVEVAAPATTAPTASAQTQQEAEWSKVKVISVQPACEDHILLTLNVGLTYELGSLCDSYRVPGMFVQLRPTDAAERGIKPSFFAISSPPTIGGVFEFLIKNAESTAWINALSQHDIIESSPVMGKGFLLSNLSPQPKDIVLFATGSGIAPIRAAIESSLNGVNVPSRRSVTLFYGARTPERMAYSNLFDAWKKLGVNVIPVISRADQTDSWDGRTGYVQHVLKDMGIEDGPNTAVLLCGVKGMVEDTKTLLLDAGVPESNILLNF